MPAERGSKQLAKITRPQKRFYGHLPRTELEFNSSMVRRIGDVQSGGGD